ncbi:MAG: hypothetical protein FJX65_09195 [Alphaproteobacteria bacterium]|nr:hypothetical protein [Alphaproteobacteria bacterium]
MTSLPNGLATVLRQVPNQAYRFDVFDRLDHPRVFVVGILLFALLNLAIYWLADSSCYKIDEDCAKQHDIYSFPTAKNILDHGSIVDPTKPDQPSTYRQFPPLSGAVMALALWPLGGSDLQLLVLLQALMLLATATLVRSCLSHLSIGLANLAFLAVIFNPNLLVGVHVPQTESLFALFMTAGFAVAWGSGKDITLRRAAVFGCLFGLATLVRPSNQFLFLVLPFVFPLVAFVRGKAGIWRRPFLASIAAMTVALATISPWLAFQVNAGVGLRLSGPGLEALFILNNLKFLTKEMPGEGNGVWRGRFETEQHDRLVAENPGYEHMPRLRRDELWLADTRKYFAAVPFDVRTFAIAMAKSTIRFFISGGEGEIHSLFGMEYQPEISPIAFYGIKAFAIAYALMSRLLGMFGAFYLLTRGDRGLLVLAVGLVAYFWLAHFVHGKPRFRAVVEPQLAIFAAFGVAQLFVKRRVQAS